MGAYVLGAYVALMLGACFSFSVWIFLKGDFSALESVMICLGFFAIFGGLNWIGYGVYLAQTVVPKVDSIIDAQASGSPVAGGEDWLTRWFRLIRYSCASAFLAYNRRCFAFYDFRDLPISLRLPIAIFCYWMLLAAAAGAISYLLTLVLDLPPA